MKRYLKLTLILSLITIYSCGNYINPEPEQDNTINFRPNNENGLAIGVVDFGEQEPIFDQGWFRIKTENAEKRKITVGYKDDVVLNIASNMRALTNPKLGIESKKRFVYLFTVELKEGNYDFYEFGFKRHSGFAYSTVSNCGDFKIPFNISKNKITYLGEIKVNQLALLKKVNAKPFNIRDNFEKNLDMFKQKYKYLYLKEVENQTISEDRYNTGIFQFE